MIDVTKRYGKVTAVDSFTVTLEDGKLIALLGPSGCGKSTILNMLAGIVPVTCGKIYFDDDEVTTCPPEKRGIGLVFQNYALYPHMTVYQNICFPLEIQKVPRGERARRAQEIARLVKVGELMDRRPGELSGGQQQRVAIARALIKNPRLLLLDEPLSNLDARLRLETREEIRRVQLQTGVTTVFVTHDQEEAMSISDSIVLMRSGKVQQCDQPQNLYNQPANQFVVDFLGNPPANKIPGRMKGDRFIVTEEGAAIPFAAGAGVPNDRPLMLTIRAESVMIAEEDAPERFQCEVVGVYEVGKDQMASLRVSDCEFRAFLSLDGGLKRGDTVDIALKRRGAFLFDAETGERYL